VLFQLKEKSPYFYRLKKKNQEVLNEARFRLDISKKFLTMRVVNHWQRLPREAVAAPSLAVLKARLDGALNNLV